MPIIPTGYGQINWRFEGAGLPYGAQVTMGFERTGSAGVLALATSAYNAWKNEMLDDQSSAITLVECLVKLGPTATGPSATYGGSDSGAESSAACPPNVAALVRKQTGLGGRHGRGRFYLPGVPEASVNAAGQLQSPYFSEVNTSVDGLLTALTTAEMPPVLLHNDATSPTTITDLTVSSLVATQRRRLRP